MKQRVVITGMGVVSPIGNSVAEFSQNLLAGVSGVGRITLFDASALPTSIAAEVKWSGPILRDRKITFARKAAAQAWRAATATGPLAGDGRLSIGMGLELFSLEDVARAREPGFALPESSRERLLFLQTPSDLSAYAISDEYGMQRPPIIHVSACAAGTDAIGAAFRQIASGRCTWMLAGGADSMINPLGLGGFCKLNALSTRNDEPARASRPFDRGRDGFVLGEGAGMMVLESLDSARQRGAEIFAEIIGYGNSFDAHGISEPHPEARGAIAAMRRALADAGFEPEAVDCINAHGTSTPKNDPVETLAIKQVFGARAAKIPVCATKSMIGHLISAAGAVEAVAAVAGLRSGKVHPTLNLDEADPACDLDYVPGTARHFPHRVVLSNSFAFGGQNASIILQRYEGGTGP